MQTTNKTQRHLSRELAASQPYPPVTSTVTQRHLSRRAPVISAGATRYLSRGRTVEVPSKVRFFRFGFLGALVFRFVFSGRTSSTNSRLVAPCGRELVLVGSFLVQIKDENKNQRGHGL